MAGIGIVSNPYSKLNRRNPQRASYLSYIAGKRGHVVVTKSLDEMEGVARGFRDQGVSVLAINGGDGTISQTLTVFDRVYGDAPLPEIALLRGGTMNVLANNLGIRGHPEQVLYRLIEKHSLLERIPSVKQRSMMIDGQLGFLFASGTPATFLQKFYQNKTGAIGAAWLIAKIVASRFFRRSYYLKMVPYTETVISADDIPEFSMATISVLVSALPRMPMGPMLFPDIAREHGRGKLQLVSYAIHPIPASVFVPWDAFVRPAQESSIKVRLLSSQYSIRTQESQIYTLDGELYTPKESAISIQSGREIEFLKI